MMPLIDDFTKLLLYDINTGKQWTLSINLDYFTLLNDLKSFVQEDFEDKEKVQNLSEKESINDGTY